MRNLFILSAMLLASCITEKKTDNSVVFDRQAKVDGVEYGDEIIIQNPSQIELVDSTLLLFRTGEAAAKKIDIQTGRDLGVMWAVGKGPGEYFVPYFAGQNYADSTFSIYDINLRFLNNYKWSKNNGIFSAELKNQQREEGEYGLFFTEKLDNGYIVSRIIEGADNVLVLSDDKFNFVANFCNPLNIKMEDLSYVGGCFASIGSKFVYATTDFGYIVCYDISDKGEITKNWDYMLSEPIYETTPKFKIDRTKNKDGFYDIKMTEDYVFCLYSGEILDLENGGVRPHKILVFNHNGDAITEITLGIGCGRFAVTPDNKTIYSFNYITSKIIKYDISNLL